MRQQPTPMLQPQWPAVHTTASGGVYRSSLEQPSGEEPSRSYMAPHSAVFPLETPNHFLQASFTGGGHTPGGEHPPIDDDPGSGGGGHTPGGQHDDITDGKLFDSGWDEWDCPMPWKR